MGEYLLRLFHYLVQKKSSESSWCLMPIEVLSRWDHLPNKFKCPRRHQFCRRYSKSLTRGEFVFPYTPFGQLQSDKLAKVLK